MSMTLDVGAIPTTSQIWPEQGGSIEFSLEPFCRKFLRDSGSLWPYGCFPGKSAPYKKPAPNRIEVC